MRLSWDPDWYFVSVLCISSYSHCIKHLAKTLWCTYYNDKINKHILRKTVCFISKFCITSYLWFCKSLFQWLEESFIRVYLPHDIASKLAHVHQGSLLYPVTIHLEPTRPVHIYTLLQINHMLQVLAGLLVLVATAQESAVCKISTVVLYDEHFYMLIKTGSDAVPWWRHCVHELWLLTIRFHGG